MSRSIRSFTVLISGALLATSLVAQRSQDPQVARATSRPSVGRDAKHEARTFRKLKVSGEQVEKNVAKLTDELKWFKTLGGALKAGTEKKKPVLWIQALGDLTGYL